MLSNADHEAKLDELDRILNDPDVIMQPARVWSLLAEITAALPLPPGSNRETACAWADGAVADCRLPTAALTV